MNELTIVMYHYVRPIKGTEYPGIKGLELDGFLRQLDYLNEEYTIISQNDVVNAIKRDKPLPGNACWLTFDDGYKDHYKYVLTELQSREITASFFPPRSAIQESQLLDVNSVHFILEKSCRIDILSIEIEQMCLHGGIKKDKISEFRKEFCVSNRFDNALTIYVKRLLQHLLPESLRRDIISELFMRYVGQSEIKFAQELYMSVDEIKNLLKAGMSIGSHGSNHCWLDQIGRNRQEKDIKQSLSFLEELGVPIKDWVMCYPYGAFNNDTLDIVSKMGAAVGVTTRVSKALLSKDNPLTLPRFDTNDFVQ